MSQPVRVLVVHDSAGQIRSVVVSERDAPILTPVLEVGEQSSLIEGLEISLDSTDAELHDQLSGIVQNFLVEQSETGQKDSVPSATLKRK